MAEMQLPQKIPFVDFYCQKLLLRGVEIFDMRTLPPHLKPLEDRKRVFLL